MKILYLFLILICFATFLGLWSVLVLELLKCSPKALKYVIRIIETEKKNMLIENLYFELNRKINIFTIILSLIKKNIWENNSV